MNRFAEPCEKTHYPAYRVSGTRRLTDVRLIVLHSTEGGTAESVARYFASRSAAGSAHLVIDDGERERCLPNSAVPWAAPGANTNGFHIEMCGYAKWGKLTWLRHREMLKRSAYKTAFHAKVFKIPLVSLKSADLRAGKAGITTHVEVSRAWGKSDHWDPGPGFPMWLFMKYVRDYYKELL